jgi:hypothetical protein
MGLVIRDKNTGTSPYLHIIRCTVAGGIVRPPESGGNPKRNKGRGATLGTIRDSWGLRD